MRRHTKDGQKKLARKAKRNIEEIKDFLRLGNAGHEAKESDDEAMSGEESEEAE